jgi:hypothetical protein
LAFFSKTNVMIKFFHNLTLFRVINAIFCWIFRRKYLKNHNIGPWPLVRKTLNDCPPFNQSVPYKEPISRKTLSIFDRQKFERKKWCIDFCPPPEFSPPWKARVFANCSRFPSVLPDGLHIF